MNPFPCSSLGIYVHVPFCSRGKCPYCDFYSVPYGPLPAEEFLGAAERAAGSFVDSSADMTVDTLYFGGGTPSLLEEGLCRLLSFFRSNFQVSKDAEITFEANPSTLRAFSAERLRRAGFNRISIGLQSAIPAELEALGRRHSPQDAADTVRAARDAGFENISLDLMLAIPGQTEESLKRSVDFASGLGAEHLSAYLLKLEPGTPFYEKRDRLFLPDDDGQADLYLAACEAAEAAGYRQYEISNFSVPGFESRHNLKYWNCDPYLGVGPGAHSFFGGRRFHYERSLERFVRGGPACDDGEGGGFREYAMLQLRLTSGLQRTEAERRYGPGCMNFDSGMLGRFQSAGCLVADQEGIRLTRKGFLISNTILADLL